MRCDPKKQLPALAMAADGASILQSKSAIILIRWPVVLISCSLVKFRAAPTPRSPVVDIAICLYALSDIALHFVASLVFTN